MGKSARPDRHDQSIHFVRAELARLTGSDQRWMVEFVLAALGSIPWVGGFIGAATSYKADANIVKADSLHAQWLEEHARKIADLMRSLQHIVQRFEALDGQVEARVQGADYLSLVRRAFRVWDHGDSVEKRAYLVNLVANAASVRLCSDDVLRRFVDWLDQFHEPHFAIVREIHNVPGATRFAVWDRLRGPLPSEDSADAELYRLMFRDLVEQGVVVVSSEATGPGRRLARVPRRTGTVRPGDESAFEDRVPYALTGLGRHFVHYAMNDMVPALGAAALPHSRRTHTAHDSSHT